MVDAQPRSAECRVPIRLHNNSRFGRQRNVVFSGWSPVSKSWAGGAVDMTSGIAARLAQPGPHWLGPRQHLHPQLSKPNPGSLLLQGPVSAIFFFYDRWGCASFGAATHFGRLCDHIPKRSDGGHDVMVAPSRDDGMSGPRQSLSMTLSHHPSRDASDVLVRNLILAFTFTFSGLLVGETTLACSASCIYFFLFSTVLLYGNLAPRARGGGLHWEGGTFNYFSS